MDWRLASHFSGLTTWEIGPSYKVNKQPIYGSKIIMYIESSFVTIYNIVIIKTLRFSNINKLLILLTIIHIVIKLQSKLSPLCHSTSLQRLKRLYLYSIQGEHEHNIIIHGKWKKSYCNWMQYMSRKALRVRQKIKENYYEWL